MQPVFASNLEGLKAQRGNCEIFVPESWLSRFPGSQAIQICNLEADSSFPRHWFQLTT